MKKPPGKIARGPKHEAQSRIEVAGGYQTATGDALRELKRRRSYEKPFAYFVTLGYAF